MEILDLIKSRRSIRQYLDKMPSDGQVKNILEVGRWAPSGLNNQPWRFCVVKDKAIKDKIASCTKYHRIIKNAPIIICLFLDQGDSYNRDKDIMAVGACIQNMLLYAHAEGLGACWLGEILNHKQDLSQILKLDSDLELMAVISLGYPDEQLTQGSRKPLKSMILEQGS